MVELLRGHLPAGGFLRLHQDGDTAGELHHFRVGHPVGRRDDDFIAFLDHGEDGIVAGHLGTGGDADLARRVGEVVVLQQLFGKRLTQFRDATGRRVFGLSSLQRLDGGGLDEFRGIDVRLATGEGIDFLTLGNQGLGLCGDGEGERWRYFRNAG